MPNGKDVYYFSHDANARNDEKILMLRAEHGWEGYGLFWALVEMMFESKDTCLQHGKTKGIAVSYNIDITLLQNVINTAITEGLFVSNGEQFWSESLRQRKAAFHELKEKRSLAGKKGMETRWGCPADADNNGGDNSVITKHNKGKESKVKESKNLFEHLWKLYPRKKGKGGVSDTQKAKLLALGQGQLERCIERFKKDMEREGRPEDKYPYGSTFFNGGYVDYLDENYQEEVAAGNRKETLR